MTDETNASNPAFVRKLSVKQICGKVKAPPVGETVFLARVFGVATDIKSGNGDLGPYESLLGTFEGENLATGERVQAGVLFLPPPADSIIIGKVREFLNIKDTGASPVQFAVDIGVTGDKGTDARPNAYGYIYVARPVIAPAESSMMAQLRADVQKAAKALPAPKPAAK